MNNIQWSDITESEGEMHSILKSDGFSVLRPPECLWYQEWWMGSEISHQAGYPGGTTDGMMFEIAFWSTFTAYWEGV